MASRRRWQRLFILGVALAAVGGWWFLAPPRLTPDEIPFVGVWCHRATQTAPGDTTVVLELRPNRTCRVRSLDSATGALNGPSVSGWWRVEGGTLVADWNRGADKLPAVRYVKDRLRIPGLRGRPERPRILSVTEEELVLGDHRGETLITYQRNTDIAER